MRGFQNPFEASVSMTDSTGVAIDSTLHPTPEDSLDQKDKEVTAYHEAGHTLVQSLLEDADPLHKVSIIPRGPMGGATFALPEKDRIMFTKKYCMAQLQVCFGGRVAEEMFCDDQERDVGCRLHLDGFWGCLHDPVHTRATLFSGSKTTGEDSTEIFQCCLQRPATKGG